jgi:xanthine dehydrogenase molybdopterin-binding subunit B
VNLSRQGDFTLFGQVIDDWNIPRLLDQLIQSSDFFARQQEAEVYNREHPFRKRALSLVPNTFGIGFLVKYMNQAGSLVHIYRDGSVLLTHGGESLLVFSPVLRLISISFRS